MKIQKNDIARDENRRTGAATCTCAQCTADDQCECVVALKKNTGIISGQLISGYMRKYPAVVYVEEMAGMQFSLTSKNPILDQSHLIFIPHMLPVLVNSTVDFPNNDSVRHSVFSAPKSIQSFNLGTYPVGVTKQVTFEKEGTSLLLCHVHAEMSAFVVVLQNPYFAKTDRGHFVIRNVSPGEYNLTFWNEKLKSKSIPVTVTAGETTQVQFDKLTRKRGY
ncbi:MAG: hypothetical protein IIB38_15935 [Candidatus Hydrogenedentes bacterium]|nr:hypothetical protein [Candidatus Hydrogenedentota bacterium]